MKLQARLLILFLSLSLILVTSAVYAQDDAELASNVPEDLSGFLVQAATSGTLAENEDGTYTLVLETGTDFNPFILSQPAFSAVNYPLTELAGDWSFDAELTVGAVLRLEDMELALTLSSPAYDLISEVFSYIATVDEVTSLAEKAKGAPAVPETFDGASLVIQLDAPFVSALQIARTMRIASTRLDSQDSCFPVPC